MAEQCKAGSVRRLVEFIKGIADDGDWEYGDDGASMTEDAQALLAMIVPTFTDDELPPEGEDILWWYPRANGRGWKAGRFEADKEVAPGFLRASGYHWYLCGGRIGDGPTWWMYPPPDPTGET